MRLVVLSRSPSLYSTRRLVEAGTAAGHDVTVADPLDCSVACGHPVDAVVDTASGRPLVADAVIPRIGVGSTDHGLAVLRQFESAGTPSLNSADAIGRARDKLRTLQILSGAGFDVPRTLLARCPDHADLAMRLLGGPPVVLKLPRGSQGVGVMLAETEAALEAILHTLGALGQPVLLQEFVAESRGRDVRALIVGGRVVAAMARTARRGEFRSNLHRGGQGSAVALSADRERLALDAAAVLGLDSGGVDWVESRDGPKVLEVNASPGLEGLERATGIDAAGAMVRRAVELADATRSRRHAV